MIVSIFFVFFLGQARQAGGERMRLAVPEIGGSLGDDENGDADEGFH